VEKIETPFGLEVFHEGPPLGPEPLPAFFYFALAGDESLSLDPFCQPIDHLHGTDIHCFSFTLPFHGPGFSNKEAPRLWAQAFLKEDPFFQTFIENSVKTIGFLIDKGYIDASKLAVGGVSRGGFAACHLAAAEPRLGTVICFAPLTQLTLMDEFQENIMTPFTESLAIEKITERLVGRQIRFYIGNRDTRVGTSFCYSLVEKLTEANYHQGYRSPPVELIISPSIGNKGHGTAPYTFVSGAEWIKLKLTEWIER